MNFKFIHAADIHLDSPLKGLAGYEGNASERIHTATREAFDRLIGIAIDEKIDFLIIAGDIYDGDWRDYKTGLFFASQMGRLNKAAIPVYLLSGNHDAESQITKRLVLPDNVSVFSSSRAETFRLSTLNVALHGQSFRHRDVTENLVAGYPEPLPGAFNIGVLHTGLGGLGGHENYAPCSIHELVNKAYDYWALGHVHLAAVLHERPYIVFPGNPQGRHVREAGAKGARLITVEDGEITDLAFIACDFVRWAVLPISLGTADSLSEVIDSIRDALEAAVINQADGRFLVCRVVLQGRCEVHMELLTSDERVLAEARACALGLGEGVAWVEKVINATEPMLDPAAARREDAVGELQRILQRAGGDHTLLAQIQDDISELVRHLPHEVRTDAEDKLLSSAIAGDYATVIADVTPYLLARLLAREG
jgi:DNA repair exonuclease SbcCD nuclease subunit